MFSSYSTPDVDTKSFSLVQNAFLQADGLPFGDVLPERVLRRLVYAVGDELESRVPADWLWLGRHVKIGDGTTLLAADTPKNQEVWPQARTQKRGVDVVSRQHQCRRTDFRRGQRLGQKDHVIVWQRPDRPTWMAPQTYATLPETLTVRELQVRVEIRGFRVQQLVVVTTLTDAQRYPQVEIARGGATPRGRDAPLAGQPLTVRLTCPQGGVVAAAFAPWALPSDGCLSPGGRALLLRAHRHTLRPTSQFFIGTGQRAALVPSPSLQAHLIAHAQLALSSWWQTCYAHDSAIRA